ncbi:DUF4430 domain-containing protein [Brevibacillus migulae]|uniref:DUF4430 domain-containing protein n=1 Tax=Brevibacillus migulae TaxID=1644114 RepID=UPI001430E2E0|nr:DUF4430 domain-containing protein [Brevibacillus migulae]
MCKRIGRWLAALLLVAICFTSALPASLAATDAVIEAKQTDELVTITGHTAEDDPVRVPLIVFDEGGQAIFFTDVIGGGSTFQVEFVPPETASDGDATAILYSGMSVSTTFNLKVDNEPVQQKISITFSITGYQGDEIAEKQKWSVKRGATVLSMLEYVADELNIDYEIVDEDGDGEDVYIKSIDGLAEFDKGAGSGWIYRVNGEGPQAPVDRYELENGDTVELLYTSDYGNSEIGDKTGTRATRVSQSDLLSVDSAFGRLVYADTNEKIEKVVRDLLFDLANESVEEQKQYVADVGRFLQAAYERAATVSVNTDEGASHMAYVEIGERDVKELLAEQVEFRHVMEEILESSTLYKPFLAQLRPAFAVALPDRGASDSYQVTITQEAWNALKQANVPATITRGDFRMELLSDEPLGDTRTSLWFYSDEEQTAMVESIQNQTNTGLHPLTPAYRIVNDSANQLSYRLQFPLTGVLEEGEWPTLYTKENEQTAWSPAPSLVKWDTKLANVRTGQAGQMMIVASPPISFQDVLDAPPQLAWAKEPIHALSSVGIVAGETPLQYGLQKKVRTAEFTGMLSRMVGKPISAEQRADLSELSRMEAAVFLAKASGMKADDMTLTFTDLQSLNPETMEAIALSTKKGWLNGRADGRFDPQARITKAEAAVILYRFWLELQK